MPVLAAERGREAGMAKETKMKTLVAIGAVMLVAFSFGTAYAVDDQMPAEFGISNIGPIVHDTKDWSAKDAGTDLTYTTGEQLPPAGPGNDVGFVLARDAEAMHEAALAAKSGEGKAAGGLGASAAGRVSPRTGSVEWYGLAY
jgi:hypothetical protein